VPAKASDADSFTLRFENPALKDTSVVGDGMAVSCRAGVVYGLVKFKPQVAFDAFSHPFTQLQ
jgi:hypothetical protein